MSGFTDSACVTTRVRKSEQPTFVLSAHRLAPPARDPESRMSTHRPSNLGHDTVLLPLQDATILTPLRASHGRAGSIGGQRCEGDGSATFRRRGMLLVGSDGRRARGSNRLWVTRGARGKRPARRLWTQASPPRSIFSWQDTQVATSGMALRRAWPIDLPHSTQVP